jgi:Ras GTPase-activating-like protein IQGAP2/3
LTGEFNKATDFGSLLRANTPVSRMMMTYTRRGPGQQFLKHVLSENINAVISQHERNLEINPVKVATVKNNEYSSHSCRFMSK